MTYVTQVVRPTLMERLLGQRYTILHALLLAVGLALFVFGNTHESLWLDESITAFTMRQTPIEIVRTTAHATHPPLYHLGLYLFISVIGHSVFNLRLFSALGALALAALGLGPIRRATNARVGLVYTCLVIATPGVLVEGQEARMYSWAVCLVTAGAVYAFLASRDNRRGDWALFGLFSVAAAYTHYYALLAVVLIHALTWVWVVWRRPVWGRRYLVTAALVSLVYLPWLIPLGRQMKQVVGNYWIPEISLRVVQNSLLFPFGYKWSFPVLPQTPLAFGLVVGLGLGGCVYAIRRGRPARGILLLSLGTYSLSLVVAVIVSYAVRPILEPRYMFPAAGLLLLPAAYGLAALPRRGFRLLACGVFLVLTVPILGQIQSQQFNGPWPDVFHTLSSRAESDTIFVHTSMHTLGPLAYYFPDATHLLYAPSLDRRLPLSFYGPHVYLEPDVRAVTRTRQTVWLVICSSPECEVADEGLTSGQLGRLAERHDYHEPYSWLTIILARIQPEQP
ncbi:MAG: glycosyltransferase family 39 protein [Anaerolineae bacterium]|nr:glycosyltransferase family 39 protein [Anaerolineae bacterium]